MFTKCLSLFLKGFILEEKCIDWKANFILNGFLLNKWRDDQKRGWQNVLKTNQQNVRDFLHIALLNPRRTEVNNINHFAWVWAWLEMNLEPVIQDFPFWKKKMLMHSWMIHWIVCLTLKRPFCILRRSAHGWKSSNDLEIYPVTFCGWKFHIYFIQQSFFSDSSGSSTMLTDAGRRVSEFSVSSSGSYHCY